VRFYFPQYLWFLATLPLLLGLFILADRFRKGRSKKIGRSETVSRLFGRSNFVASNLSLVAFVTGLAFIIAAMARPQYPGGVEKIETRGGEIVVALDLSLSMMAQDFQPNRLEKAKREIIDLIDKLKAQTVGLVIFAGQAFVQCPPTIDYSAFRMFLDVADVGMISDTGTNLADAISVSTKLLDDNSPVDKAIIVFTDGESFEGDAEKAAKEAADKGIKVYTIGVGSVNGRPIPDPEGGGLKKNDNGEIVISRLDPDILSKVANKGNGKFFRATPGESELDDLYADIKGLKGQEKEKKFRTLYNEKYRWLLLPGIVLVGAASFIPTRKREDDYAA
jgi:Ca-activated chloride channel family protein